MANVELRVLPTWARKPDEWSEIPSVHVPLLSASARKSLGLLRGFVVPDAKGYGAGFQPPDIEWPDGVLETGVSADLVLLRRGEETYLVRREGYNYVRYAVRLTGFSLSVVWEDVPGLWDKVCAE